MHSAEIDLQDLEILIQHALCTDVVQRETPLAIVDQVAKNFQNEGSGGLS